MARHLCHVGPAIVWAGGQGQGNICITSECLAVRPHRGSISQRNPKEQIYKGPVLFFHFLKRVPCLLTSLCGFYDSQNFPGSSDLTLICCMINVCGNVRDIGIYLCVKPRQPSLWGAKSQLLILKRGGSLILLLSRPPESSLRWRAKKPPKTTNL